MTAESTLSAPAAVPVAGGPFASLALGEWRWLWFAGHIWHVAYWIDLAVLSWLVFRLTESALLVSLVGAARLAPFGPLGFIAGTWADRTAKRRLLVLAQALNLGATLGFTVVLFAGAERVWLVYAVAIATGTGWAIDFPVRRALIRDLVPGERIASAMLLDAGSLIGSGLVGRLAAGGLLALGGPTAAYVLLSAMYVFGLWMLLRVPVRQPAAAAAAAGGVIAEARLGLAYAWRLPALRGLLLVTVAVNIFAFPYFAVLPAVLLGRYELGPSLFGIVGAVDAFGSVVGTAALMALGLSRGFGRVFIGASFAVAVAVAFLGLAPSWPLALPALLLAGLGAAGFGPMQTTITASVAEEAMRGRAMGAVALSIGVLPLGMLSMGLLAEWFGPTWALAASGAVGAALIACLAYTERGLRRA